MRQHANGTVPEYFAKTIPFLTSNYKDSCVKKLQALFLNTTQKTAIKEDKNIFTL